MSQHNYSLQLYLQKPTTGLLSSPNVNFIGVPDFPRLQSQYHQLVCELERLHFNITEFSPQTDSSDNFAIKKAAVITNQIAVLNKKDQTDGKYNKLIAILAQDKILHFIQPPGQISGDDVCQIGNQFIIAISKSTNQEGASQLAFHLTNAGHTVNIIDFGKECPTPLKLSIAPLGQNKLMIREDLAKHFAFLEYDKIVIPYSERHVLNCILLENTLVIPAGYSVTRKILKKQNISFTEICVSELEKMQLGLSDVIQPIKHHVSGSKIIRHNIKHIAAA